MADQIRSINGANAVIRVSTPEGSRIIGYATGVSVQETIFVNRIDVLGQIDTKDIEPIGRTVSGTVGLMRMTPAAQEPGSDVQRGGGAGRNGLTPTTNIQESDIDRTKKAMDFFNDGFDIEIVDSAGFAPRGTPRTRYVVIGCRPTSHGFALSRGSLMGINITFEALKLIEDDATGEAN